MLLPIVGEKVSIGAEQLHRCLKVSGFDRVADDLLEIDAAQADEIDRFGVARAADEACPIDPMVGSRIPTNPRGVFPKCGGRPGGGLPFAICSSAESRPKSQWRPTPDRPSAPGCGRSLARATAVGLPVGADAGCRLRRLGARSSAEATQRCGTIGRRRGGRYRVAQRLPTTTAWGGTVAARVYLPTCPGSLGLLPRAKGRHSRTYRLAAPRAPAYLGLRDLEYIAGMIRLAGRGHWVRSGREERYPGNTLARYSVLATGQDIASIRGAVSVRIRAVGVVVVAR